MNTTTDKVLSSITTEDEDAIRAQDWDDYGLFKDYPEALKLFDEIEEERDRHLVGQDKLSHQLGDSVFVASAVCCAS